MKIAKIYLTFLENKKPINEVIDIIKSKKQIIRYHLGLTVTTKYTPQLRFYYDDTFEQIEKIDNLLNKINND